MSYTLFGVRLAGRLGQNRYNSKSLKIYMKICEKGFGCPTGLEAATILSSGDVEDFFYLWIHYVFCKNKITLYYLWIFNVTVTGEMQYKKFEFNNLSLSSYSFRGFLDFVNTWMICIKIQILPLHYFVQKYALTSIFSFDKIFRSRFQYSTFWTFWTFCFVFKFILFWILQGHINRLKYLSTPLCWSKISLNKVALTICFV